ncbi:MAG TPA: MotA/TolQ/ExbB proton channel family protein [Pirellulaceae bacterium]|nr:MotA/TolQ/ExbB proton channel family protein [Pirellulaceae bacterium]
MAKRRTWQSAAAVLRSLGGPLLIGMVAFTLLTLAMHRGLISHPILIRYLTAHPVSYVATAMFCVGMASLGIKAFDLIRQYRAGDLDFSPEDVPAIRSGDDASALLERWREICREAGKGFERTYLARRIEAGLDHVIRRGSGDGLEEELKYQADLDAGEQHESYSLVRIVTWATPMLGFLGTVIGISEALGNLTVGDGGGFETMLAGLKSSLYVAFDTTAQALTLSIMLMFVQFLDDRFEKSLLAQVERQANRMLLERLPVESTTTDPVARSIERSSRQLIESVGALTERQTELWSEAFARAQSGWESSTRTSTELVEAGLRSTVGDSVERWQSAFLEMMETDESRWQARWEQLHLALSENARRMQGQQQEMIRHGEVLERTVATTGEVIRLQEALERNLDRVAGAGQFEEAILNLSAAIHLLNGRLAGGSGTSRADRAAAESREKAA